MKVTIFNIKDYEKPFFMKFAKKEQFVYLPEALSLATVNKVKGSEAICCFVTDCLNRDVINKLADFGVKLIALRSAGFDHVDIAAANEAGITVVRVPKYSPESIAEFSVALILILNRKIIKSYSQGLDHNFLLDGLMGFNLYEKTIGIIGTGNIGTAFARIMNGFGCKLLAVDPIQNETCKELNVTYVTLEELLRRSDIVSLHCPLNEQSKHMINEKSLALMKKNAMLINTGRGGLCDTEALINALNSKQLGYAGLDVYEKEQGLFFKDHQEETIKDQTFLKLQSLNNVIITPHQAFLTHEAVENIVNTTIENIEAFEKGVTINQIN